MRPAVERRFLYHAEAVAVAGTVSFPSQEILPAQGLACLPVTGGLAKGHVKKYRYGNYLTVGEAHSETRGFYQPESNAYTTLVTCTIERLNIMDVVTADAIVARISTRHAKDPKDGEQARISLIGTSYENLKIAGCRVEPDLAVDWFDEVDTYEKLREAYHAEGQIRWMIDRDYPTDVASKGGTPVPARGAASTTVSCSLVRNREPLSGEIKFERGGYYVPEVGMVHLAELFVNEDERQLTMVRAELGCPTKGTISACSVRGNGTTWPR